METILGYPKEKLANKTLTKTGIFENNLKKKLKEAYEKSSQLRVQFDDFREIYGDEVISRDMKYIEMREAEFEKHSGQESKERKNISDALEEIVIENFTAWIEDNEVWIKRACIYDDIRNGVDAYAAIKKGAPESYLALGIDAATGNHMLKKFQKIKDEIKQGKGAIIKYFISSDGSLLGMKKKVPRIVIGVDKKGVLELVKLWTEEKKDQLKSHHVQIQILSEVLMQCDTFGKYAKSVGQEKIAENYQAIADFFNNIWKKKQEKINLPDYNDFQSKDKTFFAIKQACENIDDLEKIRYN